MQPRSLFAAAPKARLILPNPPGVAWRVLVSDRSQTARGWQDPVPLQAAAEGGRGPAVVVIWRCASHYAGDPHNHR